MRFQNVAPTKRLVLSLRISNRCKRLLLSQNTHCNRFWQLTLPVSVWTALKEASTQPLQLFFWTVRTFAHLFIQVSMRIVSHIETEGENFFSIAACQWWLFYLTSICEQEQPSWLRLMWSACVHLECHNFYQLSYFTINHLHKDRSCREEVRHTWLNCWKKKVPVEISCTHFLHAIVP